MAGKRPTTVAQYILAAAPVARSHLRKLRALLRKVAPNADEVIKWGNPFFVEPRFLFAFSAHKAHLSFAPSLKVMQAFRKQLEGYDTTQVMLRIPYDEPLPEAIIRKLAKACVADVKARQTDSFW